MKATTIGLFILLTATKAALGQSKFIDKLRSDSSVTGLQLIWMDKNKVKSYNLGSAYTGIHKKVSTNTIFQAASLSKVVLAYITMQLVAEKKIDIDTPLHRYFDYTRMKNDESAKEITARMVLNHTTGWPNWTQSTSQKTWSSSILQTKFKPGTKWSYSGEGFVFLQLAIQNILKKDFQSIVSERVFKPLGMKNSSFIWEERFAETATYGHNSKNEPTGRSEYFLPNAAFSLLTTATDYGLFLQALVKSHLSAMLTVEVPIYNSLKPNANATYLFWGLGLGIQKNELGKTAWHWGDNGDYKSFFIIHPEKQQLLICLTNSKNGLKLMKPIATHFFGKANWYAANWLN